MAKAGFEATPCGRGETPVLRVTLLRHNAMLPTRTYAHDGGLDLYLPDSCMLFPQVPVRIPLGIAVAIPVGYVGVIQERSSLFDGMGFVTHGNIIDAGYRGEIHVLATTFNRYPRLLQKGSRIAQLLILPVALASVEEVATVADLGPSDRGSKGIGSSGI